MDPYEHSLGSPFAADQPRQLGQDEVACCDWCEAVVNLDEDDMVAAHTDPETGADCPGSYGDDWHVHFKASVAHHPMTAEAAYQAEPRREEEG